MGDNVTVSVLRHPELGSAHTRTDGTYEIAVNGGEVLTLVFAKTGTLGLERQVQTHWNSIDKAPDVELTPLSTAATLVTIGAGVTSWQPVSSLQTTAAQDPDGARTATLFVPPGTTGSLAGPTWNIRLTEYTIGANGARRMPGDLPRQVGYNYAFAATIDGAISAGIDRVDFNQPLPVYVDNFPGNQVGAKIPIGSYDRASGAWVAEPNGVVLKVTRITGGVAYFDATGTGETSDAVLASTFGISIGERTAFASQYGAASVNKTYWRMALKHFSDWDANWGIQPPNGAVAPDVGDPDVGDPVENSCEVSGSIIECQNQVLRENFPIAHTPYTLVYSSGRTRGQTGRYRTIRIWLTGATLPTPNPISVVWRMYLAGREFSGSITPFSTSRLVMATRIGSAVAT